MFKALRGAENNNPMLISFLNSVINPDSPLTKATKFDQNHLN